MRAVEWTAGFCLEPKNQKLSIHFCVPLQFQKPDCDDAAGRAFAGLVPALEKVTAQLLEETPLGMDLDVTREAYPWMSYA